MMAMDGRYRDRDWSTVEADIRRQWEAEQGHQGTWNDVKDAIHYTWDQVHNKARTPSS